MGGHVPTQWAEVLVAFLQGYLLLGLVFALAFVTRGVAKVDPAAQGGSTWGFRLLILPASVALWPLLAWRWLRRAGPTTESNAHRDAARSRS